MSDVERWQDVASCKGTYVDEFFLAVGQPVKPVVARMCSECPVRMQCAISSLPEQHGYFAGSTARERARLRTQLRVLLSQEGWEINAYARAADRSFLNDSPLQEMVGLLGGERGLQWYERVR